MKEADIVFGVKYACSYDGATGCWTVVSKAPPKPGGVRSRTYWIEAGNRRASIDASKIMMPWSEYEQTDEYQEQQQEALQKGLAENVLSEMRKYWSLVAQYVESTVPGIRHFPQSPQGMGSSSAEEFLEFNLTRGAASVTIGDLLKLADVQIPKPDRVKEAFDQQKQVMTSIRVKRLPAMEKELTDALSSANPIPGFPHYNMREYVDTLIDADIPGPHAVVTRCAALFPDSQYLKRVAAENSNFAYLIPYLDYSNT